MKLEKPICSECNLEMELVKMNRGFFNGQWQREEFSYRCRKCNRVVMVIDGKVKRIENTK